ncbi:hypothetical protein RB195_014133 [Necator americanus]|uniref:Endonuclease/exonuclease/phosphatase domain-containing protein n=1 Tax=Necator americanus TaxID=51031 RepID=A0ABR1DYU3_NECAM
MPAKSTRTAKRQTPLSSQTTSGVETRVVESSQSTEPNYSEMSASDLISSITERNKDPVIGKMLAVLAEEDKTDFVEQLEADKRSRSIVISGQSQRDFARAIDLYRLGKPNPSHPRLVKVVLPSQFYWRRALANARLLRSAGFSSVCIRKSMKPDKRKREYELRQEARERNKDSELVVNLPYNVYRSDRSMKRGSGVCAIAKAFISAQIVTPNYDLKADLLSADIFCSNNMSQLRFILVYRPPNSSAVDDKKLVEVLSDLAVVNNHAIILGDFNLHVDWVNSIAFNSASSLYLDFFSNAELVQNVNLPTHSDRILDIILTPSICTLDVKLLPPLASSDHAIIQFDSPAIMSAPGIPMPNFLNADYSSLNNYFSGVDWLTLFDQYSSCSDIYFRFCKKVYEGLAKFVPFRFPRSFSLILPCQLKSLYTQKLRRFEELDDPLRSSLYKKLCSDIDFHMRRYLAYRERQLSRRESKKPFYLYLRHRMKANARLPSLVDQTGATYVTDADKTKAPAMHFANVFSSNCSDTIPEIVGIGPVQQQCSNMFFHPTDIYIHLKSLEPSVSETYDGIPPIVYKECAAILSPPLAHIFNISLSLGEVPQVWKNAIVTVIPKSPGASTYTNLTDSVFDWSQALNQGKSIAVAYIDLSKAFDKIG